MVIVDIIDDISRLHLGTSALKISSEIMQILTITLHS